MKSVTHRIGSLSGGVEALVVVIRMVGGKALFRGAGCGFGFLAVVVIMPVYCSWSALEGRVCPRIDVLEGSFKLAELTRTPSRYSPPTRLLEETQSAQMNHARFPKHVSNIHVWGEGNKLPGFEVEHGHQA